jgi:hypothetical protein
MLLRRKPKPAPVIEAALCMQTFRPGAVAVEIQRGDRLPIDHPAVTAFPSYFLGVVPLPLEGVKTNG